MKTKDKQTKQLLLTASLFMLVSISSICKAQIKPVSLRFEFINEMTSLPTYKVVQKPIHPGFLIGVDVWEKTNTKWPQTLGVDFGYYYHRLYEHAFMLDGSYSFGYKFQFGLRVKLLGSLGYKHSILSGNEYKFEDGDYKESTHWGKPQFNAKVGIGLEYPVYKHLSLTANVKEMLALPYAPKKGMPFATHSLFSIGVKYSFLKN